MKNTILFLSFLIISLNSFAQDLTTKKGEPILPQKGDWAISVDATPFLKYVGNFIGGNGLNVAPTFNFLTSDQTLVGKYYINDKKAIRVGIRFGTSSDKEDEYVLKLPYATTPSYVTDQRITSNTVFGLSAGVEFRKGKSRLQGFYGYEAGLVLNSNTKITNTYGNPITSSNRVTHVPELKGGSIFGLGIRGFLGAEYFILPKISLGGEFGWGLSYLSRGEGKTTTESWNGTQIVSTTNNIAAQSSLSIDSENNNTIFGPAGKLRLTFHF